MQAIKDFVLKHFSKTFLAYLILVFRYNRKYKNIFKTLIFSIKALIHFYAPSKKLLKGAQLRKLFNKVKIEINEKDRFVYNIDIFKTIHRDNRIMDNVTVDYSKVLNSSINEMKKNNEKMKDCDYKNGQKELLIGIEEYIDRECKEIEKSNREDKEKIIKYLNNIKDKKADGFEESIQRILFFNQLLWQVGHGLNGLGRLDKILGDRYEQDLKSGKITRQDAKEMIKDFAKILHQKFWYKSNVLMGDTGQIIILGGKELDGSYFCNDLTYIFIEAMEEIQLPDPKVFLRVTDKIPRDLMELSLRCIKTYDEFINKYKEYLKEYTINFVKELNEITWEEAPLLSLLTDNCNEKLEDVANGGAKYNNYGVTSVSLGTVVNSLYNIKKFVFDEKEYSLKDINEIRKNNFENNEELLNKLKQQPIRYGTDNKEVIDLTNEITGFVDKVLDTQKSKLGGKIKFGFSAPTYIIKAGTAPASFDGRKNGEAFGVHISSDKASVAYTELIQFATKLEYNNHRFNGNVIDFMITPSFIESNFDKMVDFLILSISLGFFQMQMNVTSSDILIKAKSFKERGAILKETKIP